MRYVALTLSFFFLFSSSFCQTFTPVFETNPQVDVEARAMSFAHWWEQAVPHNLRDGQQFFDQLNINITSWLRSANFDATQEQWEELFMDFHFYHDQPARFKEKIYRWMEDASNKCPDAWKKMNLQNDVVGQIKFTSVKDEIEVHLKNASSSKLKLKSLSWSGGSCSPKEPFIFSKKNNKVKKAPLTGDFKMQGYQWNGSATRLDLVFSDGKTAFFELKAKPQLAPFIKEFYVNDAEIFEGQKISMTWYVLGTDKVELNEGIGTRDSKWQMMVAPEDTTVFTLRASNEFGISTKDVNVWVDRTVVESMTLTLFTPEKADAKELGTPFLIEVIDKHDQVVASYQGLEQMEISGKTPYVGPFTLDQNDVILKKDLVKAFLRISIPDGAKQDKYVFSPIVIIKFSNGSKHDLYGFGNKEIETGGEPVMIQFSTY